MISKSVLKVQNPTHWFVRMWTHPHRWIQVVGSQQGGSVFKAMMCCNHHLSGNSRSSVIPCRTRWADTLHLPKGPKDLFKQSSRFDHHTGSESNGSPGALITETTKHGNIHVRHNVWGFMGGEQNVESSRDGEVLCSNKLSGTFMLHDLEEMITVDERYRQVFLQAVPLKAVQHSHVVQKERKNGKAAWRNCIVCLISILLRTELLLAWTWVFPILNEHFLIYWDSKFTFVLAGKRLYLGIHSTSPFIVKNQRVEAWFVLVIV